MNSEALISVNHDFEKYLIFGMCYARGVAHTKNRSASHYYVIY